MQTIIENTFEEFIKNMSDGTLFQDEIVQWEFRNVINVDFYSWFISNCEYFNENSTIQTHLQYKAISSSCFNNSQNISLKNKKIKYYEGIMHGEKFQSNIHHGFNIIDNKVFDITMLQFPTNFEELRDKNFFYCGVYIPDDFILAQFSIIGETQHCPILYKFFLHQSNLMLNKE